MSKQPPITPIRPSDNSLPSHLQALDALSHRLSALPSRTRWPARIPLNTKASISGQVIHTNELKVDIGAGYWIEMTAKEAEEYVQRRKNALLLQHAGLKENVRKTSTNRISANDPREAVSIVCNPMFAMPAAAGPSKRTTGPIIPSEVKPTPLTDLSSASRKREPSGVEPVAVASAKSARVPAVSDAQPARPNPSSIEDVVDRFLESQGMADIKNQRQKGDMDPSGDAMVNEEGLPIREIREDMDGLLIGDAPEPTTDGNYITDEPEDDYWSEEAKARREILRNRLFGHGDDDSDLSEAEEEDTAADVKIQFAQISDSEQPSSPIPPVSPSAPSRSSSISGSTPRSILKPAPTRKKSVTFDESVPLPPDSPPVGSHPSKMGFPLPVEDYEPRPVPVIAAPRPMPKASSSNGFGGFKRGFLDPPKTHTPPIHPTSTDPAAGVAKKGPSLFAQRMAAQEHPRIEEATVEEVEDVNTPPVKGKIVERPVGQPGLPKMSETKPMTSMKNAVVERESAPSSDKVKVEPPMRNGADGQDGDDNEDDDDYDYDDGDDEGDEEDEDEYDLDEALLAREIALDYHRNQGYLSRATRGTDSDEEQMAEDAEGLGEEMTLEDDGQGGVMMALPQISTGGQIVNPTPDDLRKFVRVGRLQNGNLVLAPGEEGWSDDEDEVKRARREAARQQLLGSGPVVVEHPEEKDEVKAVPPKRASAPTLPPVVATGPGPIREVTEKKVEEKAQAPVEPPKKVSKFKAARMGM